MPKLQVLVLFVSSARVMLVFEMSKDAPMGGTHSLIRIRPSIAIPDREERDFPKR